MGGLIKYCEEEDNYAINDKFMKLFQSNEYYYSFDCIYWDFASARWRYVVKQNKIEQLPNKEARFEDSIDNKIDEDQEKEMFESRKLYRVNQIPMNDISGTKFQLEKLESNTEKDIRILRDGDLLKFH